MRILLTGGSGLLALNWACALRDEHQIILATHRHRVSLRGVHVFSMPLSDEKAVNDALKQVRPDVVVHTAGITNVDECEKDPQLAIRVNADYSRNVATIAKHTAARLIHISTDHLFAGTRSGYSESDAPEPLNAYARSKLIAEEYVRDAHPDALVVRTNFFGWGHRYRQSFSDWIYYQLAEGKTLTMFDDVFVTPILADRLARLAHHLLESGATGIYNVVGDDRVSKYAFGLCMADAFGFSKSLVQRGKIAVSHLPARRPPDMSLDNRKARERLGTPLGNVAEYLRLLQQQDRAGRRGELLSAVTE